MADYSNLSDIELSSLVKQGDQGAYSHLYQRYFRLLYLHAYKRLRDEDQAEDIVQDFFTSLWMKHDSFALTDNFNGYCFSSVNNRIVNHFLHKEVESKYVASFLAFANGAEEQTDYLVRERQLSAQIEREIQALPGKMREIFELSRKANMSYREIADKLDLSEKTVNRQISNALVRLKTKLGLIAYLILISRF